MKRSQTNARWKRDRTSPDRSGGLDYTHFDEHWDTSLLRRLSKVELSSSTRLVSITANVWLYWLFRRRSLFIRSWQKQRLLLNHGWNADGNKMAFSSYHGLYRFTILSFGLKALQWRSNKLWTSFGPPSSSNLHFSRWTTLPSLRRRLLSISTMLDLHCVYQKTLA